MARLKCVMMGGRVYVGGGETPVRNELYLVFQYNPVRDEWIILPPCPVRGFSLGQFSGELITVGGRRPGGIVTGQVYRFIEASRQWEEYLQPMPTARFMLTVITTQSAIIACGGAINNKLEPCATVEVYINETSQWHTTDPLPVAYSAMSSVTIANTCYLLGGYGNDDRPSNTVLYAPVASLIEKATIPSQPSHSCTSAWKTLPDTLRNSSSPSTHSGSLLAVGGYGDRHQTSQAVHVFTPLTNSWVRVRDGDLPEPRSNCTAIQLPSNKLLVIGGFDNEKKRTNTVFLGSIIHTGYV